MSGQHTPGPWRLEGDGLVMRHGAHMTVNVQDATNGYVVFLEQLEFNANAAEFEANARLIAAAPDLLDALKTLRIDANRLCDRNLGGTYEDDCRRAIAEADSAIDKAEGR